MSSRNETDPDDRPLVPGRQSSPATSVRYPTTDTAYNAGVSSRGDTVAGRESEDDADQDPGSYGYSTASKHIYFDWPALSTSLEKYTIARKELDHVVGVWNRARDRNEKVMHVNYLGDKVEDGLTKLGTTRVALRTAMWGYSRAGGTFGFLKENMECPEESWEDLKLQWEQRDKLCSGSLIKRADIKD